MSFNHYLSSLLLCFSFLILFPYANAFNVTAILSQYPEFATFNNLLTQTQLFNAINSRQPITVLVVENGNLAPLNGKPVDFIRKVLSIHVILDYYDVQKLQNLPNKTAIVTTLYQASGVAAGQQGFLNVTILGTQSVAFRSAVPGSNLFSNLVKSVASQPYNISILQVSNLIVPPSANGSSPPGNGNNNSSSNSTTSPPPSSSPASTPKSAPMPKTSPAPVSKAPAPSKRATPPTTTVTPPSAPKASPPKAFPPVPTAVSPTPSTADTPAGDTPAASPSGPAGVAPVADGPSTADGSPPKNAAAKSNAGTWVSLFVMSLSMVCWIV